MGRESRLKEVSKAESWPRTVSLNITDRLWLFSLLPKEGDISNLRLLREIKELINTNDEEIERFKVRQIPGGVQVDPEWLTEEKLPTTARGFSFGSAAWSVIKDNLVRLSTQKKLPMDCIDLYDAFTDESRYQKKSEPSPEVVHGARIHNVTGDDIEKAVGSGG